MRKYEEPRHRRLDLINSLPSGAQKSIARKLGIRNTSVSGILNGRLSQNTERGINVIRMAEHMVAQERSVMVRRGRYGK